MVLPKFHNLVLSSGSVYATAFIGCIKYLCDMDAMQHIKTIVGSSAGALMGVLIAIGMSPDEIYSFVVENSVEKRITNIDVSSLIKLTSSFGLDDGSVMCAMFHSALERKGFDKDITLVDFVKRSGINMVICVSNLTKGCAEYLSVDTAPDIPIALALRMSCSIPLVFDPVLYKDCYYVDGAVTDGFPYAVLDSKLKDTLCVTTNFQNPPFDVTEQTSALDVLFRVFSLFRETHNKLPRNSESYTVVAIDFEMTANNKADPEGMNITMTRDELDAHVDRGYSAMKAHFDL